MQKKNGSRLAAFMIYGIVLMAMGALILRWPWLGIPLGLVCMIFPEKVWRMTGGFVHPSDQPSVFRKSRLRSMGAFLIMYALAKAYSDRIHGA